MFGGMECGESLIDGRCGSGTAFEEEGIVCRPPMPQVEYPWVVYWDVARSVYWFHNVESGGWTFSERKARGVSSEGADCDGDAGLLSYLVVGAVGVGDDGRVGDCVGEESGSGVADGDCGGGVGSDGEGQSHFDGGGAGGVNVRRDEDDSKGNEEDEEEDEDEDKDEDDDEDEDDEDADEDEDEDDDEDGGDDEDEGGVG